MVAVFVVQSSRRLLVIQYLKILQKYQHHILILWISFSVGTHASNILGIYPFVAQSHFQFNYAILQTLAKAGHSVTLVAPFSRPANTTSTNVRFINSEAEKPQNENRSSELNLKNVGSHDLVFQTLVKNCRNVYNLPFIQVYLALKVLRQNHSILSYCHFSLRIC